ncbi:putative secreted protein [Proteiniphilum saccharofermentans]|uniref:Putative secreted protein n=2 Tax=Proteiniphilum saccharofermentans TaxID=1642647 RepID=A0A1R3T706_9BACT|nr:putative secreted protein [Proteiniphilum saccharofermentans]
MKKVSLIVLFAVLVSGMAFAQQKPEMDFKRTEHNFGTIKEEIGSVSTQFEFTNTGKSPLIIQRVSASCGCTTPSYTKEPVLPGKKGTISATYSTVRRPGTFNKTIRVYTNVPDTVYVLTIKGNVTPKQ